MDKQNGNAAPTALKRYVVFGGDNYCPRGGWDDFRGSFDSIEATEGCCFDDWWHVLDMKTGKIVRRDPRYAY